MKIYDTHVHLFIEGGIPVAYEVGIARTMKMILKRKFGMEMTLDETRENLIKGMYDPEGKKVLELMKTAGIEKSVIFGSDFGPEIGEPKIHIFEANRYYADLARKHPGKFVALASIDPRRPGALRHCEQCIEEWGMKGLKMHPAAGFYPTDEILQPFYEKCGDWGVPIVFHTGAQPAAPVRLDTARPVFVAEAAAKFPDTKMVMAHAGMDLWNEAVMFGKLIPNIYFDISTHQFSYLSWGAGRFYEWLRYLVNECGADRIMWATDSPLPNAVMPPDEFAKVFTEPQSDTVFSDEEIQLIMAGAAARVFSI